MKHFCCPCFTLVNIPSLQGKDTSSIANANMPLGRNHDCIAHELVILPAIKKVTLKIFFWILLGESG